MRPLTARERRLVALGLLVLTVGLVWLAVIGPLVGGFIDRAQERRDLWTAHRRNDRLIASLPALRATAEAQRRFAPRFAISAPSEAAASEAFKDRLRRLSTDEGFTIRGVEDLPADMPSGAVKVRADLTLTLNQLYETVRRLQSEDAYVVVDYLSVTADRSLAAGRLAPLDVRLELTSAWRPAQESARDGRSAPILACGALAVMLVVQLLMPPAAPPSEPPGLAPRRQRPVMVPPVPEYAAILASPIFAPDRQPGSAESASPAGGEGSLSGYAALGVIAGPAVATAVIAAPGGAIKTLHRGEEVDGWRLAGVERTRVYFERNGVRHALVVGAPAEATADPDASQTTPPTDTADVQRPRIDR